MSTLTPFSIKELALLRSRSFLGFWHQPRSRIYDLHFPHRSWCVTRQKFEIHDVLQWSLWVGEFWRGIFPGGRNPVHGEPRMRNLNGELLMGATLTRDTGTILIHLVSDRRFSKKYFRSYLGNKLQEHWGRYQSQHFFFCIGFEDIQDWRAHALGVKPCLTAPKTTQKRNKWLGEYPLHEDFDVIHHNKDSLVIKRFIGFTHSILIHAVYSTCTQRKSAFEIVPKFLTYHVIVPKRLALKISLRIFLSRFGIRVRFKIFSGTAKITRSIGILRPIHTVYFSSCNNRRGLKRTPAEIVIVNTRCRIDRPNKIAEKRGTLEPPRQSQSQT